MFVGYMASLGRWYIFHEDGRLWNFHGFDTEWDALNCLFRNRPYEAADLMKIPTRF